MKKSHANNCKKLFYHLFIQSAINLFLTMTKMLQNYSTLNFFSYFTTLMDCNLIFLVAIFKRFAGHYCLEIFCFLSSSIPCTTKRKSNLQSYNGKIVWRRKNLSTIIFKSYSQLYYHSFCK